MSDAYATLATLFAPLESLRPKVTGSDPVLPTRFRLGAAAAAAIGAVAAGAAVVWQRRGGLPQTIDIDLRRAAASLTSFRHLRLNDRPFPVQQGDVPTMAIYRCADGRWIHLHGALPHLRDGTLKLLGCADERAAIAAKVSAWTSQDLEDALAAAGQCGAILRTAEEWAAHPQGQAVAAAPLVELIRIGDAPVLRPSTSERPLSGFRVLDLTRILAGPTCGRTLAEHGADVLRISSPALPDIPLFVPDTSHGKRSAYLDLDTAVARQSLERLIDGADVFSQGYRSGSLAARGFGPDELACRKPGIVVVSINAYGHDGPWAARRGWEQLAQSCSGVALMHSGCPPESDAEPSVIPAAPADYCTGYLAALGTIMALLRRMNEGGSWHVRVSLTRTAMWMRDLGLCPQGTARDALTRDEIERWSLTRDTDWGRLSFLGPVAALSATPARWDLPAANLGAHPPTWP